jgi:hypothetical protein
MQKNSLPPSKHAQCNNEQKILHVGWLIKGEYYGQVSMYLIIHPSYISYINTK